MVMVLLGVKISLSAILPVFEGKRGIVVIGGWCCDTCVSVGVTCLFGVCICGA